MLSYRMCPRRDNERKVGLQNSAVDRISKNTQSQSPETQAGSALASEETLVGLELRIILLTRKERDILVALASDILDFLLVFFVVAHPFSFSQGKITKRFDLFFG
jgi:hypothetical protein